MFYNNETRTLYYKTLRICNLRIPYKLVCLWLKIEKTLAYYEICAFAVDYESVMFYNSGTKRQHHNEIFYLSSPKRFIEYSPGLNNIKRFMSVTYECGLRKCLSLVGLSSVCKLLYRRYKWNTECVRRLLLSIKH